MTNDLENKFEAEMWRLYKCAKSECNYNATYFLRMLNDLGGLETAKKLLKDEKHHEGFTKLWELKRLDLTVENLVLRDHWNQLFTKQELETARKKLTDLGYFDTTKD